MLVNTAPDARPVRPRAYSYVRFSTPEQAKGDSYRRQIEQARVYAAAHGLELDERETFLDSGVSAFSGLNALDGQLGAFQLAVMKGDIAPGSFLLIENLDRLSRMAAWQASMLLGSIVALDITIVALSDKQVYSREILNADPNAMFLMVLGFMRANQESVLKATRVREAWSNKRTQARSEGRPMTVMTPGWLELSPDRRTFNVIEDRAAIVRHLFAATLQGVSQTRLAETLNRDGVPTWGKGKSQAAYWHRSYVHKLLLNPSVIGTYIPHSVRRVNGKRVRDPLEPVLGYYPAVVTPETFDAVQHLLGSTAPAQRESKAKGTSTVSSYLAGLARCPACEATMTRVNKGRSNGTPYFVCTRAKAGAGCAYHGVKVNAVEDAIHANASWLCAQMPTREVDMDAKAERLQSFIDGCDHALGNLVEEIERGNQARAIRDRLSALELERAAAVSELDALGAALEAATGRTLSRQGEELEAALGAPEGSPAAINAALRALFSTVTIDYRAGQLLFSWRHAPEAPDAAVIYGWPKEF